jgi:hypothetical protein
MQWSKDSAKRGPLMSFLYEFETGHCNRWLRRISFRDAVFLKMRVCRDEQSVSQGKFI